MTKVREKPTLAQKVVQDNLNAPGTTSWNEYEMTCVLCIVILEGHSKGNKEMYMMTKKE